MNAICNRESKSFHITMKKSFRVFVERLYERGAIKVTAIGVSGYLENDEYQDTDKLIIELPQEPAKRKQLFK